MGLVTGSRLASRVCAANVVVLDQGSARTVPECGGLPMIEGSPIPCSEPVHTDPEPAHTVAGVIYYDPATGMTVRCTRSGSGRLTVHGRAMLAQPPRPGAA